MSEGKEDRSAESPPPALRRVSGALAIVLCAGSLAWSGDLYRQVFGLVVYTEQFLGVVLAVAVPLVFVSYPARRGAPRTHVPFYDVVAAVLAFAAGCYIAWRYPALNEMVSSQPWDGLVTGGVIVVLVLEALRRAVGQVLFFIAVAFIVYGLVGRYVPGDLAGRPLDLSMLTYYLAWDTGAMLGIPLTIGTTIVIAFVFFGQLLFKSGGSEFFTDISLALMGRFRGGSAKIAITASALFGSISGSAVSNVVATGVITIPLMRQGGYPAHLAGAIEAVASTGGQLMPPIMGAAAFLMAEFLQVPYTQVVVAVIIPSLLYYVGLFISADLEAAKNGIARVEESRIPAVAGVLKAGWYFPIPFGVLILSLFVWNRTPEESALYSAGVLLVCGLLLGYRGKRMRPMAIVEAIRDTGTGALEILMIGAAAGFIIGVLNISGLGFGLTIVLVKIGSGSMLILLSLAAIVCIILGLGMPTAAVYVLLAALVAPALVEVGISPMAAHLYVLYFGMLSMITPPVAIAAFAAASLAGADAMRTGFAAVRFGWTAFVVPILFIAAPSLLMEGTPLQIVWATVTAVAGVWFACFGVIGYITRPIGPSLRVGCVLAGLMMLIPAGAIRDGLVLDFAGIALAAVIWGREFTVRRRLRRSGGGLALEPERTMPR